MKSMAPKPNPAPSPERPHVLSQDCWCQPVVETYGILAHQEPKEKATSEDAV